MSRTDVPKLVPGPTMAEVAAEYDHRRAELKEAVAAERRAVVVRQHPPGRMSEAQADIAAARAPIEDDVAVTRDLDAALSNVALVDTPAVREMGGPVPSDEALDRAGMPPLVRRELARILGVALDPPVSSLLHEVRIAVIERRESIEHGERVRQQLESARRPYPALDPANLPPGAVLLTGNEAAHYRRLQDAARASQAAQNALAAAGAELRDAFGALCRVIADGKVES